MTRSVQRFAWQQACSRFLRNDRGSLAILFAASATVLVLGSGVSIDLAHAYSVKARLQSAVDSAALAVGANSPTATSVTPQMTTVADDFVSGNFPNGQGVTVGTVGVTLSGQSVTVAATATVSTTFLSVINMSSLQVAASGTATRALSGLEVVMVLDNTASLNCCGNPTNFQQLQNGAKQLATTLFGSTVTNNAYLRVGVVPYTGAVNPYVTGSGSSYIASQMISGNPKTSSTWTGCVVERYSTFKGITASYAGSSATYSAVATDLDSAVTTAGYLQEYLNSGTGCPTTVLPMTNTLSKVTTTISAMSDGGGSGTIGSVGMAWGYRMLSPQGPFAAAETVNCWATQTCAANTPNWKKVLILMTDGVNSFEGHSYNGFGENTGTNPGQSYTTGSGKSKTTTTCSKTEQNYNSGSCMSGTDYDISAGSGSVIDAQEEAICDALRARGVTIYSIFLNSGTTPGAAIQYCAGTTPGNGANSGYYYLEQNTTLVARFTSIGNLLTNLRLSQ